MSFTHLHVHTQYSLLEGALRIEELVAQAKAFGMSSLAMTDKHQIFGAIDFYQEAKSEGLKPILGCELFYTPEGRAGQPPHGPKAFHLIALCKNLKGYQNLSKLLTESYLASKTESNVFPKAVVDKDLLDRFGDELIFLSGGLKGEIPYFLLQQESARVERAIHWFQKRFKNHFYFELQDTGLPEQTLVNQELYLLGKKYGVPVVGTAPAHYLNPEDAEAHEVLQCIEYNRNLEFDRPKSLTPAEYYFKPADLMKERLSAYPGAYEATQEIASQCNLEFQLKDEKGRTIYHLPQFRPDGVEKGDAFDLIEYFRAQARQGLEERFQTKPVQKDIYQKRLEEELVMIERTGFAGYFLIVADFINWAKRQGIPVGPGRGSGAGSIVAYSLKITDIDPIEFNLLFERFINPERISMPDFDVDFCQERRGEVIEYVAKKYGQSNVCQIITFGKLQARAVIKDVGRVFGMSFSETDAITKLLPDRLDIHIKSALEEEPRLREKAESDFKVKKVLEYALKLEGLSRNAGIHAAGVIITEEPVVHYCPLFVGRDGDLVSQYDKDYCETIGLIKFDFLGLKTLTVIDNAVGFIRAHAEPGSSEEYFKIENIPLRDEKVFELIGSGDTDGVFQVESSGMKDLCLRLKPNSLEDLTAINALFRPGPLGSGMVDDFIDRKHQRTEIRYELPQLESILKDTYGVILYQEQVMQIARELAGYSLGQADLLRRAMGKKKAEEMAQNREIFVSGALKNNLPKEKAENLFDLMAKFAEYGFNKSHSAAYALITYQTAYLKTHYPAEFMAALMTTEMDNIDKMTKYITDARAHGISVLSPDVNQSKQKFTIELKDEKKAIRFGLEAIKGVGGAAVESILEARKKKPFENFLDFCRRVSLRKANKKVLESLVLAGAFDGISEVNRPSLLSSLEGIIDAVGDEQEESELGQTSLFDAFSAQEIKLNTQDLTGGGLFKQEQDWPLARKLALEKQVVGFFMSGHPMDPWQMICESWLGWSTEKLKITTEQKAIQRKNSPPAPEQNSYGPGQWKSQRGPKSEVQLAGILTGSKEITTRKGSRMAFVQLEDLRGKLELIFFPEAFQQLSESLKAALAQTEPVVITGDVEWNDDSPKIMVRSMEWVTDAQKRKVQSVIVTLDPEWVSADQLRDLKKSLLQHRGKCPVKIEFEGKSLGAQVKTSLKLPTTLRVSGTAQMVGAVNQIFGRNVVSLH